MKFILYVFLIGSCIPGKAQTPEAIYHAPLSEVLLIVEKKFDIHFLAKPFFASKTVRYAQFRMRPTLAQTLDNILKPLDLVYKKVGENTYDIYPYQYYRKTEIEGKQHLDQLLGMYYNIQSFELRKADLHKNIAATMGIDPNKKRELPNIIRGSKRIMKGYSVENIAVETFPGYYLAGNLYQPLQTDKLMPAVLCPHGHFPDYRSDSLNKQGRYNKDVQIRCASLAKMGASVFSYDMYSWGESMLHTNDTSAHGNGVANAIQTWNSIRAVDFITSLPNIDLDKIAVTGASGGGTQTMLLSALDQRIGLSVPVVMMSSSFYGGCECESGLPIHFCVKNYTNNAEIAASFAPKPLLVISDGDDWTVSVPNTDYPYLKKIYGFYEKDKNVESVFLPNDKHDYGITKRTPMYYFIAKHFNLDVNKIKAKVSAIDESFVTIEPAIKLQVFSAKTPLPSNALNGHLNIVKAFKTYHQTGIDFKIY